MFALCKIDFKRPRVVWVASDFDLVVRVSIHGKVHVRQPAEPAVANKTDWVLRWGCKPVNNGREALFGRLWAEAVVHVVNAIDRREDVVR